MIDQSIYRKTCVCSRDPNYEEDPEVLKDLGREGLCRCLHGSCFTRKIVIVGSIQDILLLYYFSSLDLATFWCGTICFD